jgi:type I protein arginine methyltransferase
LPWREPVVIEEGQEISVALRANLVGKDYIWRWETEITATNGDKKTHFRQSTFEGAHISSHTLPAGGSRSHSGVDHRRRGGTLSAGSKDGRAWLKEIGKRAAERFPEVYSSQQEAFERASELARKFSS